MRGARLIVLLVCIAGAVASGCGDDGRLTRGEYIDRVNDANREVRQATAGALEQAERARTPDPKAVDPVLAAVERQVAELAGLRPPEEWDDEHRELVAGMRASAQALRLMRDAALKEDLAAYIAAAQAQEAAAERVRAAILVMDRSATGS